MSQTKEHFIELTYDDLFLSIFANPEYIGLTEYLVATILGYDINDVKGNIEIKTRNLDLKHKSDKKSQVDLLLKYKGEIINIELQRSYNDGSKKRNFIYLARIIGNSFKEGMRYNEISKTIQIIINNSNFGPDKFTEQIGLVNLYDHEKYSDDVLIFIINLQKQKFLCYDYEKKLVSLSNLLSSKTMDEFDKRLEKLDMDSEHKTKLSDHVKEFSNDENEYQFYLSKTKTELDHEWSLEAAKNEGIQEGIDSEKVEIAKNLINSNVDINVISSSTGLSIEEIENLKESI